ncbi:unnamed protein product [Aphanomyces euteiches]|uniref:Thioredoxin domain-containing protein n=1 Tax=Aphanomyces euteiches TaxID=100861 RepID=A0A6G0X8E2_9STRA|nr:hypothetical protein Ae201684_007226 [Aphanomyces euteiches]KAH9100515.1 hypothetical protein Ae201684P_006712 [Aphanomyces euteiches]KAH9146549.1 hypothetical protein AeRB84_009572 [Aphanomyces euteiches]
MMLASIARRSQCIARQSSSLLKTTRHFATFEKDEDGIVHISSKEDWDALVATGKPVVADFWAPWCGKCTQISGFYAILAEDFPDVTFAKLNVAEEGVGPVKEEFSVEVLPAFHFFNKGQQVGTPVLGYKKSPLKAQVTKLISE